MTTRGTSAHQRPSQYLPRGRGFIASQLPTHIAVGLLACHEGVGRACMADEFECQPAALTCTATGHRSEPVSPTDGDHGRRVTPA